MNIQPLAFLYQWCDTGEVNAKYRTYNMRRMILKNCVNRKISKILYCRPKIYLKTDDLYKSTKLWDMIKFQNEDNYRAHNFTLLVGSAVMPCFPQSSDYSDFFKS